MKKQIALIATAAVTAAALAAGSTLAFFTDQGTVRNDVTMGNVEIALTEPAFDGLTSGTRRVEFLPGDIVAKDPTVTNVGESDAYVRCRVSVVEGGASSGAELGEADRAALLKKIDSGDWVRSEDGYYYYQKILPKAASASGAGSSAKLFDAVEIPKEWGGPSHPAGDFRIVVAAEAIQADHFTPERDDKGRIVGWNDGKGPSDVSSGASSASPSAPRSVAAVAYAGDGFTRTVRVEGAENLDTFRGLMPGGSTEPQKIVVRNESGKKMGVYFRAQPKDDAAAGLLDVLQLTVTFKMDGDSKERTLYQGPASGKTGTAAGTGDIITAPIRLGYVYGNSTSGEISAVLTAPKGMGNTYQSAQAEIGWALQFELASDGGGGDHDGGGGNHGGGGGSGGTPASSTPPESIGDESVPKAEPSSGGGSSSESGPASGTPSRRDSDAPSGENVPDGDVPLSSPPKTGQDRMLPVLVCAAAAASLLVFAVAKRKSE